MPEARPERHRPAVRLSENQATGLALKRLRKRAELTQEDAAGRADVVVQSWRRYEWGERNLGIPEMSKLAEAIGSNLQELLAVRAEIQGGAAPTVGSATRALMGLPQVQGMPIRGRIQAGAWLRTEDIWYEAEARTFPCSPDPRFPADAQWLEEVSGDSVNALGIFDGDLVHLVSIEAIGYSAVTGDLLKVERLRFQGREREVSLKELEMTPTGAIFWPRSTNPNWSKPLDMRAEVRHEEEIEVQATALVLNAIRRMWRPGSRY